MYGKDKFDVGLAKNPGAKASYEEGTSQKEQRQRLLEAMTFKRRDWIETPLGTARFMRRNFDRGTVEVRTRTGRDTSFAADVIWELNKPKQ